MRLLVTGSPGWLSDAFLEAAARGGVAGLRYVRCLFHRSAMHAAAAYRQRFASSSLEVDTVEGDLTDRASLQSAVAGMDVVLHGAAIMHPKRPRDYFRVNTCGTRDLAEAAAAAGVSRFVFVSSNAAGGRSRDGALMTESDPSRPASPYGLSKRLAEEWLMNVRGSMERVVLRPCMFYGAPVPQRHVDVYERVVRSFMPLVGSGDYARSLVYVDNLVQAVGLALSRKEAAGQTYYVADAQPYTTREVMEAMARALGVEPRYLRLPAAFARLAYAVDRVASIHDVYLQEVHLVGEADWNVGVSIEKARRELGYDPRVSLHEGMQRAVDWCRAQARLRPVQ
ncbi:MAG TPA: NAD-dependent epimerase/dehydratase family protein [Gemmatimonadaceae bacterium]|nr:NAD-dependent epimerase/dehydratase family protein [Gemmatimonadaceae bacterium]